MLQTFDWQIFLSIKNSQINDIQTNVINDNENLLVK